MWVVGDWGQASPWSRNTGVRMVKGANDVYTGELSLPRGTNFNIKILKSTVSTTSGGENIWSAARYVSTLNMSASHDFGEFTNNLIPNGNFDEGQVKWTPAEFIEINPGFMTPNTSNGCAIPDHGKKIVSDPFTIPAGQTLRLSGYVYHLNNPSATGIVSMKVVSPQNETLFEFSKRVSSSNAWTQFSKTFKSGDTPLECKIELFAASDNLRVAFDTLSLVSP